MPRAELTRRQTQIAAGILADMNVKQIAAGLGLSGKTVAYHWQKIKRATGVKTYAGLVLYLTQPPKYEPRNHLGRT